jgi:hypothetical protein
VRRLLRPIWVLLALVFLLEAWLWDRTEPIFQWIVDRVPIHKLKAKIATWVETLTPAETLIVFALPVAVLIPFKLTGLWLLAEGKWLGAVIVLIIAKIVAVAATAFVFDVTRDSLLQLFWFRWMYGQVMAWRDWAHLLVEPVKRRIKVWLRVFAPHHARRSLKLLRRFRRSMHARQSTMLKPDAA